MSSGVLESSRYVVSANVSFGPPGVFGGAHGVPSWHTNEYRYFVAPCLFSDSSELSTRSVRCWAGASVGTTIVRLSPSTSVLEDLEVGSVSVVMTMSVCPG